MVCAARRDGLRRVKIRGKPVCLRALTAKRPLTLMTWKTDVPPCADYSELRQVFVILGFGSKHHRSETPSSSMIRARGNQTDRTRKHRLVSVGRKKGHRGTAKIVPPQRCVLIEFYFTLGCSVYEQSAVCAMFTNMDDPGASHST